MTDTATLLEKAIYDVAATSAVLMSATQGRVKHGRPLAGWKAPYATYSFPNLPASNTFGSSGPRSFVASIFFDIFSANDFYAAEIGPISAAIRTAFDGASLEMEGFRNMTVKLAVESPLEQEITGLWHVQLHYRGIACLC